MHTLPIVGIFAIFLLIVPATSFAQESQIKLSSYTESIKPNDSFLVFGKIDPITTKSFVPVQLRVIDPAGNTIYAPTLTPNKDGEFKYLFKPTYITRPNFIEGTYTVTATHPSVSNPSQLEFTVIKETTAEQPVKPNTSKCNQNELLASDHCVPYEIVGGSVSNAIIKADDKSLAVTVSASRDGMITLNPSSTVISGIHMVLMDGQEWDRSEINGNTVTVEFESGTHTIELVGTFVIPEFGTVASMILIVSLVSVIIITGKNRLPVLQT